MTKSEVPNLESKKEQKLPQEISDIEADELAYEQSAEYADDILHAEDRASSERSGSGVVRPSKLGDSTSAFIVKDPIVIEVEKILEDGVGSFYDSLPDQAKSEFKRKGEATASEISEMVRSMHVKFKRLVVLISDWLKTIPGVNRFFLEQEAKLKADRIIQLVEARKNDKNQTV